MAQRTILYDWHKAHQGRLVDFAGWEMPVQYSTIVEEHQAVRGSAGVFDVSHMGRLNFSGPDALGLFERITTNSIATMKDGQVRYALVCNELGGVRDDVLVYRWPDRFSMVVNASNREKILGWIQESRAGGLVEIEDSTFATAMIALQGPKASDWAAALFGDAVRDLRYYFAMPASFHDRPCVVSRTGYTGEDGFEFIVPNEKAEQAWSELIARGAKPCGLGARDTLRLEAAMPLYGHELNEELDPLTAGLGWAVKFDKGDFRGREALRAIRPTRKRVGIVLQSRRIAREGTPVVCDGQPVGQVTSGTFSPTLNQPIAMAYVDIANAAPGTPVQLDIRGTLEAGQIVRLPFYRRSPSEGVGNASR